MYQSETAQIMRGNKMADVRKMKMDIVDKAEEFAKALSKGKDIMITKSPTGISVKILTVQKG